MTIREASSRFNIDEKEIRKRKQDGMIIGAHKEGRYVVIPDDTEIIPSKKDIQSFLFQILKYKNNPKIPISRSLCANAAQLEALMKYLYKQGLLAQFDYIDDISELFNRIQLTDEGISFIFGEGPMNRLAAIKPCALQLNSTINLQAIKVG